MKSLFKITLFVCLFYTVVSCKKARKLKEFDLQYSQEITIPSNNTLLTLPFDVGTSEVTTNSSAEYENEGTTSKLVEEVLLTSLKFIVKSPTQGNFNFLNSIEIYLTSSNNQEVLIASRYNIPENDLKELDMETRLINLKNYINDKSFSLRVKTVTDKSISYDLVIQADQTFKVKARVKNIFKRN